jgi:hypothetical protein
MLELRPTPAQMIDWLKSEDAIELTGWVVNHHSFGRLTSSNLQEEMVNGLAFSGAGIAEQHNVLSLIGSWNRDPCRGFIEAEVISEAGD